MHIAARTKEGEKCAEMLLKSGADVNATREVNHRNFINGWHTFLECGRSWVQVRSNQRLKCSICSFSVKYTIFRSKSKGWLAQN